MKKLIQLLLILMPSLSFAQKPELIVPTGRFTEEITLSPDGKYLLTWEMFDNPMAILWDWYGNELRFFDTGGDYIQEVSFSEDGQIIFIKYTESISIELSEEAAEKYWEDRVYVEYENIKAWKLNGEELPSFEMIMKKVDCSQLSPNGQAILTGTSDGFVKVWTLEGSEIKSIKAHDSGLTQVDISPDGKYLITKSENFDAAEKEQKLWDLNSSKLIRSLDPQYNYEFSPNSQYILQLHSYDNDTIQLLDNKGNIFKTFINSSIDFLQSPPWVSVKDSVQKLWNPESNEIKVVETSRSPSLSSQSHYVLIKDFRGGDSVRLLNLQNDRIQKFPPTGFLGFSHNGQFLKYFDIEKQTLQLLNLQTQQTISFKDLPGGVDQALLSPDNKVLLTRKEYPYATTYKLFDVKAQSLFTANTVKQIANEMSNAFIDSSGTSVGIGESAIWDLKTNFIRPGYISRPPYTRKDGNFVYSPERDYFFGSNAESPVGDLFPVVEEKEYVSLVGHTSSIITGAFSSDGQNLISGSFDKTAILWSIKGEKLQTFKGHTFPVWGVSMSDDKQYFLTGTKRMAKLWKRDSSLELASLVQVDTADWIVTTPSGLFDASPYARNLLHYSLFYEKDQEYVVIDVEQLKARYYEPGLLQKVLGFTDERVRPVENFNDVKLYPKIEVEGIRNDSLIIRQKERNGGLGRVSIFINGKEVAFDANPLPRGIGTKRRSSFSYDLKQHQNYLYRNPDSTNIISIRAYNEEGWLESPAVEIEYKAVRANSKGSGSGSEEEWEGKYDPKFYVLSIGTSEYTGEKLDLKYADQDATMMAKALHDVGTALVPHPDSIEVYCFSTSDSGSTGLEGTNIQWGFAEKKQIIRTLENIKERAKAEDVLIVYLSGHGVAQRGQDQTEFYYLTHAVSSEEELSDPATLQAYTISSEELTKKINDIPALKQVLIIDACNSGQVVENITASAQKTKNMNSSQVRALDRMRDRTGMFIISGSASDKVSYEASEYGQGLLTYSLLQGILGPGTQLDLERRQIVDVMNLFQHARNQVPELAKSINGIQKPMLGFPSKASSFAIGLLSDEAKVNIRKGISLKKPIVIKSNFMNQSSLQDDLNLEELMEIEFREETEKGKDADVIYVDVSDYPDAYSLGGLYTIGENKTINLTVRLFLNGEPIKDLEIKPTDKVKVLTRSIFKKMKEELDLE